jgi:carbon monoxide dehydrogenase subunit G
MRLEQSFEVAAPVERVWEALVDVRRVAPCLPGAEIDEVADDGVYRGTFTVKLGPTTAAYRGELRMAEVDESAHRVAMRADGRDKRGQGTAKASIVSVVSPAESGSRVEVDTDFALTGRLARFGRGGMIQDVSNRLMREFASCLQGTIESGGGIDSGSAAVGAGAPAASKPVSGLSLFLGALLDRLRRLFRRN